MNKILNLIKNICFLIALIAIMYFIKKGEIKVEESSEMIIWIVLILLLVYMPIKIVKDFKRDNAIGKVNGITKKEQDKIKELSKKNEDYTKLRIYIILTITFLCIPVAMFFTLKMQIYWLTPFVSLFFAGIAVWRIISYSEKTAAWYYNLDEFLYEKYQLVECLNKKQKMLEFSNEIEEQKRLLKQRKELKQMEKALVQPEEKKIREINIRREELKNYNEYTKILPDGSELRFAFTILRFGGRKNITYNIKSTLYTNSENIKSEEERENIIKKNDHMKILIDDSGVIQTQFASTFHKINYELLINWVTHSYEICCQLLKK